jgi:hypothetical protein
MLNCPLLQAQHTVSLHLLSSERASCCSIKCHRATVTQQALWPRPARLVHVGLESGSCTNWRTAITMQAACKPLKHP